LWVAFELMAFPKALKIRILKADVVQLTFIFPLE
jgi:hypothetical protein